jgi:AcrR family transcriptional regulator
MRQWVPVSTSPKGRLAVCALQEFGRRSYHEVTVGDLAVGAGVTTGALYHHFESKLGLYSFVRIDAERRVLDRMEGAAATHVDDEVAVTLRSVLLVGFDFAVKQGFVRLLGEDHPGRDTDPVADLLADLSRAEHTPLGNVLAAAWRAALLTVSDEKSSARARAALQRLSVDEAS